MQYLELFSTPIQVNYTDLDIKSLTSFCYSVQQDDKDGVKVSNLGGWQSQDVKNNKHKEFVKLRSQIQIAIDNYHSKIQFKNEFRQELGNIWININGEGHSNEFHVHADAVLSGVFYLNDSGVSIIFKHHNDYLNLYYWHKKYVDIWNPRNSGQWGITPKKNMLVIFPAWAPHKVEINKENFNRISISFNTQCKDHNK